MGYTLCVLGCGTMGVAIVSGVLAALAPHAPAPTWGTHTPGTLTPAEPDPALPARFLACVSRAESAQRLRGTFAAHGAVELVVGDNAGAARRADVVLLWCAPRPAPVDEA
jgi:pyrroline-5-carboxylate reductase